MTFGEYFAQVKFKTVPLPKEVAEVYKQGCRHVFRDPDTELWDKKRPTEPKNIQQWRKDNRRNISSDLPDTYLSETISLIQSNGFSVSEMADRTSFYLENETIHLLNNDIYFDEWFYKSILPDAIIDPNAYYVIFPTSTTDAPTPNLQSALSPVKLVHKIIFSENIRTLAVDKPGGSFCFVQKEIRNGKQVEYTYLVDNTQWIRIWEENNTISNEVWYNHNLGYIPCKILPGKQAKTKNKTVYQESLLKAMYNILDEFATQFDDDKVMRAKGAHQILVMPEVACNGCGGERMILKDGVSSVCGSCGGTGKMRNPGPADTFVIPTDTSGLQTGNRVIPMFIGPDVGTLEHSWKTAWELWDKAANTHGIDAIINSAESGEAMKMRLLKNEKSVNDAYQRLIDVYEFALNCIDGYLYPDEKDRKYIYVQKKNIEIKTKELLKLKFNDSLPVEKQDAAIEYFNVKYSGDPIKQKKYEILIKYFPASMLSGQDLRDEIGLQVYTEQDIKDSRIAGEALDLILDEKSVEKSNIEIYKATKLKIVEILNS